MRSSSYNIISARCHGTGDVVLLHGLVGSMDVVPGDIAERVLTSDANGCELPPPVREYLVRRGYLTLLSPAEEEAAACTLSEEIHKELRRRPHFVILPQTDCNFRCTYCWEKPLQTRANTARDVARSARARGAADSAHLLPGIAMDAETVVCAFRAIDELLAESPGTDRQPELVLFGGEPLDASVRATVAAIVDAARKRSMSIGAVSNGYDLPVFEDLFGPTGINNVQITIDGPQEVHDTRRVVRPAARARAVERGAPGGSYDTIVANVTRLLQRGDVDVTVRINTDRDTLEGFDRLVGAMEQHAWFDSPRFRAYATVTYKKDQLGRVGSDCQAHQLYARLQDHVVKHWNFHVGAHTINRGLMVQRAMNTQQAAPVRPVFCAANCAMYLFSPDGLIYPCWESIWDRAFAIGRYRTAAGYQLEIDTAARERWCGRHVAVIPECRSCRYALVCGGGCAIYAYYNSSDPAARTEGSLYRPFCDDLPRIFPEVLRDLWEHRRQSLNGQPKPPAPSSEREIAAIRDR